MVRSRFQPFTAQARDRPTTRPHFSPTPRQPQHYQHRFPHLFRPFRGSVALDDGPQCGARKRSRLPELQLHHGRRRKSPGFPSSEGRDILEARRKRKSKLIVVDPYRTTLAEKADLWLRIRPGTDAALALGMMKIMIDEGLYDREFVSKWCYGFEEVKERVSQYPVEKVSEITWLPPDQIEQAARMYATIKPAALHHRVAIEHNINSTQTARALAILVALTGNVDVPGGNVFPVAMPGYIPFGHLAGESHRFRPSRDMERKRLGAASYPLISGRMP